MFITAHSMVSSLGWSSAASCAAARAGVGRPSPFDAFPVKSPVDGAGDAITVHAVRDATLGFEGDTRLLRLCQLAVSDLMSSYPGIDAIGRRASWYLSLPDPGRIHTGLELVLEDDIRASRAMAAEAYVPSMPAEDRARRTLGRAAKLEGWTSPMDIRFVTSSGHAGVAEALAQATSDIAQRKVPLAIVGGVDSLIDDGVLRWLEATGRLKSLESPMGLMPGEAAAFCVLEPVERAEADRPRRTVVVKACRTAEEQSHILAGKSPAARAVTDLLREGAAAAGWIDGQRGWVVADLNGETARAAEWGLVVARLRGELAALEQAILWCPAISFGDTGAASGAVGLCVTVRGLERGYAPSKSAVILSASEGPKRGVIVVSEN